MPHLKKPLHVIRVAFHFSNNKIKWHKIRTEIGFIIVNRPTKNKMAKRRYSEAIAQYVDLEAAVGASEEEEGGLEDEGEL